LAWTPPPDGVQKIHKGVDLHYSEINISNFQQWFEAAYEGWDAAWNHSWNVYFWKAQQEIHPAICVYCAYCTLHATTPIHYIGILSILIACKSRNNCDPKVLKIFLTSDHGLLSILKKNWKSAFVPYSQF
jgi:uncharacterized protein YeaO (DUF488 family)